MTNDPSTGDSETPAVNEFAQAKQRLASHPETSAQTLGKLALADSTNLVQRVAENPNTSSQVLEGLAEHEAPEVRSAVSDNPNTPLQTVGQLADDEHPDVRYRVAENPNSPEAILHKLTTDENPYVGARAKDTLDSVKSVAEKADQLLLAEKFAEAELLYTQLVSGLEHLLGPNHCEVAKALHKLAAALSGQSKTTEAEALEARASTINAAHQITS